MLRVSDIMSIPAISIAPGDASVRKTTLENERNSFQMTSMPQDDSSKLSHIAKIPSGPLTCPLFQANSIVTWPDHENRITERQVVLRKAVVSLL